MLAQHLSKWELPGKVVPPDNWHVTIRFLGWVDQVRQEVLTALLDQRDRQGTFEVGLGAMGAFPRETRAGVLWLGIQRGEENLADLYRSVEAVVERANFPPEGRPYSAHLTLSRLRPPADTSRLVAEYQPQPFRWRAEELVLFQSLPGPTYDPVERFPL